MDTLKVTDALKRGGFSEAQARALVDVLVELVEGLATKKDLEALRTEIKQEIAQLRLEMNLMESRLTIKLGGMIIAAVAALAALQKLL